MTPGRCMQSLVARGYIANWADVKTEPATARPRMIMALAVETDKPRLVYDARALNRFTKRKPFPMDTVGRVTYMLLCAGRHGRPPVAITNFVRGT